MSFSERLSSADLQNSALSRRDLLGKTRAIVLGAVAAKSVSYISVPKSYPLPKFQIGDLIASDWEPDDDDAPEFATDFGEILGMRWLPEPEGTWYLAHTWVYYVRWTHGTCGSDICYPCYDGESSRECDLRLVSRP